MTTNEELAKDHRDNNSDEIRFNRRLIIVVAILIIGLLAWTAQTLSQDLHTSMEECEIKLYEHLTKQKAPDLKELR